MAQSPSPSHELRPSIGVTSASAGTVPREIYALLILVAASIVGARILTAPGAFSANDASRWATVRALVETGSYSLGYREEHADGTYRDVGVVTDQDWESFDIVMDPATRRFYSSKPTLLPTLVAGEYWVLRQWLHLDMKRDRIATRTILVTFNLVPFVLYLLVFARLIERLRTTVWGGLFVFTAACLATFVSAFLPSLNNHTVAAMGALFAIYHCICIDLDGDRRWWRFTLAGLFAGWMACNELPSAMLACGLFVWLLRLSVRDTLRLALPAMLLPVAAYLLTQYLAFGSIVPTYLREDWYYFAGSYWQNPQGIDRIHEPKLVYATHLLTGHTGILSLTPVLALGWIGAVRTAAGGRGVGPQHALARLLAWMTAALTVVTFLFYVARTESYGGLTAGPRWFFWLVPLWLITMLPEADRWAPSRRRRAIAFVLMAFSIAMACYALENPWRSSLLLTLFQRLGITSY